MSKLVEAYDELCDENVLSYAELSEDKTAFWMRLAPDTGKRAGLCRNAKQNSRMLLQNRIGWVGLAILISVLALWLVIPVVEAWRADRLVDELCAKDGGVHVYERLGMPLTVAKLPNVPPKHLKKEVDELYYVYSSSDIRGSRNSSDIGALVVFRTETALHRARDDKLLAIAIGYVRRGGDPIGPWHPSSYQCPRGAPMQDLLRSVLKQNRP